MFAFITSGGWGCSKSEWFQSGFKALKPATRVSRGALNDLVKWFLATPPAAWRAGFSLPLQVSRYPGFSLPLQQPAVSGAPSSVPRDFPRTRWTNPPGPWLQCQANGSNVGRVLRWVPGRAPGRAGASAHFSCVKCPVFPAGSSAHGSCFWAPVFEVAVGRPLVVRAPVA